LTFLLYCSHNSPKWSEWDGGKIGGAPSWINPKDIPQSGSLRCDVCKRRNVEAGNQNKEGTILRFITQIYSPADSETGNDDAFHRSLYVFCCPHPLCSSSENANDSVVVLRGQLPKENAFYPNNCETIVDESWKKHKSEEWNVNRCIICGQRASGKCPIAEQWFCCKDHQRDYHKALKKAKGTTQDLDLKPYIYKESELEESQAQFDNVMKDVVYYLQINPKAQYLSSILAHSVLHGQRNGNLTPMNPPVQERIVYTQDVPTNTPANDLGNIQVNETNSVPHQRQQQNFPSNFIQSLPSSLQPSKSSPSYGQLVSISEENAQSPGRPVCRFDDGSVLSYRGIYERPRRPGEENYDNMVEIVDERCLRDSDIKREDIYERPRRPRDENYDNMVNTVDERCLRDSGIKREDMASKDAVIVEVPPNNFPPLPVPSVAKAALIDLSKRIDGKSNPLFSLS